MDHFMFQPDVIFNLELPVPYWFALEAVFGLCGI